MEAIENKKHILFQIVKFFKNYHKQAILSEMRALVVLTPTSSHNNFIKNYFNITPTLKKI